jgi:hypothetical protein
MGILLANVLKNQFEQDNNENLAMRPRLTP